MIRDVKRLAVRGGLVLGMCVLAAGAASAAEFTSRPSLEAKLRSQQSVFEERLTGLAAYRADMRATLASIPADANPAAYVAAFEKAADKIVAELDALIAMSDAAGVLPAVSELAIYGIKRKDFIASAPIQEADRAALLEAWGAATEALNARMETLKDRQQALVAVRTRAASPRIVVREYLYLGKSDVVARFAEDLTAPPEFAAPAAQ